ncbi:MAG: preprotein translocase subunit SecA [Candidatus Omnitrophica bacterium]|nr:preprotein translocase subunit SecA [Candidatus Omnitrophota bacterium]MDE2223487.1 preprotein translocase subunit SecA [Candidatus Omnitrophota bacterium]
MFDFLVRKGLVQNAQGFIDRLNPKVQVHIHPEAPLPSIGLVKKLAARASEISALEDKIKVLSDEQLKAKTAEFKARIQQAVSTKKNEYEQMQANFRKASSGQEREDLTVEIKRLEKELFETKQGVLDEILNEAFAVVRETGRRVLNMRHFDVQLVGGMVLHTGGITEMTTGEGKTLVATLPAYLNALAGDGVHVVTVNDYLANRDCHWMGPIYEFLGLTVGVIQHDMNPRERKTAYGCDITYGTNNEFGFDYLRDNMVSFKEEMVQRGHAFAIVDEVDSILIDEARTPLIISGPAEESTDKYYKAFQIARQLKGRRVTEAQEVDAKHKGEDLYKGYDYLADEKAKSISLSDEGETKAAGLFGVKNLHEIDTNEYRHHVICALRAKEFFVRDVDYVVKEGKVIIVDEFTGRMMPGRRWSDGLHQAVEAREGIKIERENQTLATITFQNYFRMYGKLAGMTGTAYTEANEFKEIYKLDVVVIPTNRKLVRLSYADCIYKTVQEKYNAVVEEIAASHQKGQPVLVGTISIEKSEVISQLLKKKGIPHQVLNAKYHELEAHIIAQAGRYKAVTIATNMAGRGTDIVLGGNAEYLARALAAEKAKDADDQAREAMVKTFIAQFKEQTAREKEQVLAAGGLHVIGTERHESRRIDNQLRGRCGRQGDPGSSRFYVSLQDDLMRLFASENIMMLMDKLGMKEGEVIESRMVTGALEVAQKRVENYNFEIRKQLLDYDNVMNKQREVIYSLRRSILEGENLKDVIIDALLMAGDELVDNHYALEQNEETINRFAADVLSKFLIDINGLKLEWSTLNAEQIKQEFGNVLIKAYENKETQVTSEVMRRMERMILLHVIDTKWKDHLYSMDQVKDGISLRAYGQRDPLVEYKKEGYAMFKTMYASINHEVAAMIFRLQPMPEEMQPRSVFSDIPQQAVHQEFQAGIPTPVAPAQAVLEETQVPQASAIVPAAVSPAHAGPKVGRNDPCPCGSGKKYKKCCGASA